ncbi:MAG: hypothetical protein WC371_00795 [Parachlamydiales bacterium]|jgi:DNA repair ATPase RecN
MNENILNSVKSKTNELQGKLKELITVKDDQKKVHKIVNEIRSLQNAMEKAYRELGPFLEKMHIDKQTLNNTSNDIKRACNQPSESNIQNALKKVDALISQLAA